MIASILGRFYARTRGVEEADIPAPVLLDLAMRRVPSLIRGCFRSVSFRQSKMPVFIAKQVEIRNGRQLVIGRGVAIGAFVQIEAYGDVGVRLGDRVTIGAQSSVLASAVVREKGVGVLIGENTSIGIRNTIWGQGGVSIGANCLLGPDVLIVSENHTYAATDVPIRLQMGRRASVNIGSDTWIGAGVKIMPGVQIGHGSVIGAGSVVTRDLDPFSVAVGVPARVIGNRND